MEYADAAEAQQNLMSYLERAVRFNEPIGIRSPEGSAVLISEEEYDALMETVFLMRSERTRADIFEAVAEELEEAVLEQDAGW